ncbi:hypothetical protein K435DRAFT_818830 [Dendrothele bispora CBS 962.96]|uniref:Helitron helicase-like domain-containing protein n=1 Tax=Dendrothele bispora (strain CBS 962.96) TaxID=1314807 RepID=A0A4S8M8J4_DENBC|nr:hypothetical protein K435DRAFT_818830 [Dendrothele bispora CBS 962.96]
MTCNPKWPEIKSQLRSGQNFSDVPIVVARVFRRRLALFEKALHTMFRNAGKVIYLIRSIEFQKCRGLPHAHILIKLERDCVEPAHIDSIISASMPSSPEDADLIQKFMIHKHPRESDPPSDYCQRLC